jgi:hypothetical protein
VEHGDGGNDATGHINDRCEVWAKIITQRASYYISREGPGEKAMADDEAELEIVATIDAITSLQRKHLGQEMVISLPAAENAPRQVDDGQC